MTIRTRSIQALKEMGEGTAAQVAEFLGIDINGVHKALNRMKDKPLGQRQAHIDRWVTDADIGRAYPRAVFVLGPGRNASRPPRKPRAQLVREYHQRAQARMSSTSLTPLSQKAARAKQAAMRAAGLI